MKDDRLSEIVLSSRVKRKAGHPRVRREEFVKKELKKIGNSREGIKWDALNILGWRRSMCSCTGLTLGAALSCLQHQ